MKRLVAIIVAVFCMPVLAAGQGILIPMPDIARPAPDYIPNLQLRRHVVHVSIADQTATTRVEQVFYNPTSRPVEGSFLFPLPKGAHLSRFSMDVNGRDTEAELLDSKQARAIYEDIVRRLRDPALLEYADGGLLRARIFPIESHREKRVTLTYTQLLSRDNDVISYTYPLNHAVAGGRSGPALSIEVSLASESTIAQVYSPSHDLKVHRKGPRDVTVEVTEAPTTGESGGAGAFQLHYTTEPDKTPGPAFSVMTYRAPGAEHGYFLLLASPRPNTGDADGRHTPLPKDIVFVLDTSGSMAGRKLEQAKRALRFCLANLNDNDRFDVVRFSTEVEPLFGTPRKATPEHRQQGLDFIADLKPIGGTAIHAALTESLGAVGALGEAADRPRFVVFLTDGRPTIGEQATVRIVDEARQRADETRVFCFGIGTDVNTHLLDGIAEATRAVTQYVLPDEDLEIKVSQFYIRIAEPAMTDLSVGVTRGDIRLSKMHPVALPDLFRGDQLALFGTYHGEGEATVYLKGRLGGQPQTFTRTVTFAEHAPAHAFLPRLWAMRRVGHLLDQIRLHGEDQELRDEVVRLARDFGIVTPYTAYLIVEDEDRRAVPQARQSFWSLRSDAHALDQARGQLATLLDSQTGAEAVAGATSLQALKQARAVNAPMDANILVASSRAGGTASAQQTRYVNGRTFVRNGTQWVDTQAQSLPLDAEPRRIVFNSDAYFDLLAEHPGAAAWLSVGRELRIVIDEELHEIVDDR